MSASGPRMTTFHKRLYTALPRALPSGPSASSSSTIPRVRSNSASSSRTLYTSSNPSPLSFFESGVAPPTSRPHIVARLEGRVEVELHTNAHTHGTSHHGNQSSATHGGTHGGGPPPWSLALTSPQSNPSSAPYSGAGHNLVSFLPLSPFSGLPACDPLLHPSSEARPHHKRQRTRYHLDVGAYGIAKRRSRTRSHELNGIRQGACADDLTSAVSVGEDAYFVRDNAMGVADGVGGWSRVRDPGILHSASPESTASALFARRLMHYCSVELDRADDTLHRRPAEASPSSPLFPCSSPRLPPSLCSPTVETDDLCDQLQDSLEELEEGLDVLMILERAYEQTLAAHVLSRSSVDHHDAKPGPTDLDEDVDKLADRISPALKLDASTEQNSTTECAPLLAGSSTALVAILDHSPSVLAPDSAGELPTKGQLESGAVLRIAHLGDSMGMLVRGEEIVWRSEEMWSSFNTPLQLGPCSATKPTDAQIITVPVQADDILILATDGLSDNLWDEEILDEVARFRRTFLKPATELDVGAGMQTTPVDSLLGRRALAGMLSEALCSRARQVSERGRCATKGSCGSNAKVPTLGSPVEGSDAEVPFARRARENGRSFFGGKTDDISVVVAVISANEARAAVL